MTIVLDSSALLAIVRGERGSEADLPHIRGSLISSVNLSEYLQRMIELGVAMETAMTAVRRFEIEVVPYTAAHAASTASLRALTRHLGLSLGDRACLALALERHGAALTSDQAWGGDLGTRLGLDIRMIR